MQTEVKELRSKKAPNRPKVAINGRKFGENNATVFFRGNTWKYYVNVTYPYISQLVNKEHMYTVTSHC